jgi:hypothetical protein
MNIAEAHSSAADRVGMHSLFGRVPEVSAPATSSYPMSGPSINAILDACTRTG